MKNIFPEYFAPTKQEFEELWENAIFALDTNILVHFYRYSEPTRKKLIEALMQYQDRIWIPHWVGHEFFNQRLDRIGDQVNSYEGMKSALARIVESLKSDRHPFVSSDTLTKLESLVKEINDELDHGDAERKKQLNNDTILEELQHLIGEKVGLPYSDADLLKIVTDGEDRYKKQIPPGFKDKDKKDDPNKPHRKYGDLIIWRQLIDLSKKEGKPIIFISDDEKEDWILMKDGRKIGPLPALRKEFRDETKQNYYSYNAERFLEFHNERVGTKADTSVLTELREVQSTGQIEAIQKIIEDQRADFRLLSGPDAQDQLHTILNEPHFTISQDIHSKGYSWTYIGYGNILWFTSLNPFLNIQDCIDDCNYVAMCARHGIVDIVSPFANKFGVSISAPDHKVVCRTVYIEDTYQAALDIKESVEFWMPLSKIKFR